MKTIAQTNCPNCWGYQTYGEQNEDNQVCTRN